MPEDQPLPMTNPRPRLSSWQTTPWHPAVLVVVVVLAFWMDAVVSPYAAFRSLLIAVLAASLLTVLAALAFRNRHAGGVFVTGLMAILYTKHLVRLVEDVGPRMQPALLVLWLLAMALAGVLVVRIVLRAMRRMTWSDGTWVLNRIALVLLIGTVAAGVVNGTFAEAVDDLSQGGDLPTMAGVPELSQPDIYVILLDGYPRADVLEYAFGIDNSPFEDELRQRGFEIAPAAHSDYLWTHVSLSSMLNMAYVEEIEPLRRIIDGEAPLYPGLYNAINHNAGFDLARSHGYDVVGISAGFEQLTLRQADVFIDGGEMNEYELKLINSTWLGQVVTVLAPYFAAGQHADRVRSNLDALAVVAAAPHEQPRIVFDHVGTPHQPSVFGRDGELYSVPLDDAFYADSPIQKGMSQEEFDDRYRANLEYVNGLILESVDDILAASDTPPVIVFWADHGSASRVDWLYTEPDDAEPARLLERTGTFFAALTPGREGVFPADPSPASLLRYLFDAYLGTNLGPAVPPPGGGQVAPVDASVLQP
jgi:hypothetical protein